MHKARSCEHLLLSCAVAFLAIVTICKLTALVWTTNALDRHDDGPWTVQRPPVLQQWDSSLRYGLNASLEWAALVSGDGLVYVGPDHEPHMVSMLHQLRCLDVVREGLLVPKGLRDIERVQHCMHYLKQMLLCRGETQVDPFQYDHGGDVLDPHPIRRCLDWSAVYSAVAGNQKDQTAREAS